MLQGHLDIIEPTHIVGWAFDDQDMSRRVELALYDSDEPVLRFKADKLRHDFKERGQGDGFYGFWVALPKDLFNLPVHRLSVRFVETGRDIANSPQVLHASHPQADEIFSRWLLSRIDGMAGAAGRTEELGPLLALCVNALDRVLSAQARLEEGHAGAATTELALSEMPERMREAIERAARLVPPFHMPLIRHPSISIVIAATPSLRETLVLLNALVEPAREAGAEVICVDATGSAELALAPLIARGGVRFLKTGKAGTMLDAYRLGLGLAQGRYVLFLSGVRALARDALRLLRQTIEDADDRALVSPRLVGPDDRIIEAGTRLTLASGRVQLGRFDTANSRLHALRRSSDDISPQAFMVAREHLAALGNLDGLETYAELGMADLAFRAREAGGQVLAQGASDATLSSELALMPSQQGARLAFVKRWQTSLDALAQRPSLLLVRRALVIDERLPQPDQDAASHAVLSHCESLVRLGFHVEMIGLDDGDNSAPSARRLNALGIEAHTGIEDIEAFITGRSGQFDLVYLHRVSVASKFMTVCRASQPKARIVYSVADLHFLRLGRQADIENDDALREHARAVEADEKRCLREADQIITHSTIERDWIEQFVEHKKPVHRLLWSYRIRKEVAPFAARRDVAFLGNFHHKPNGDAVRHFAREIWPRIRAEVGDQQFEVAGAHIEAASFEDLGEGVRLRGFVQDVDAYLDGKRLTIAPLRFGAGVKGKVLQSFAAGVPCVLTPIAAEGMGLSPELTALLVAETRDDFVEGVVRLMRDALSWQEASEALIRWASEEVSSSRLDATMAHLIA